MSCPLSFPLNHEDSFISYNLSAEELKAAYRLAPATIALLESLSTACLKEQGEIIFRGSPESQFDELKRHISLTAKRELIAQLLEGAAAAYQELAEFTPTTGNPSTL